MSSVFRKHLADFVCGHSLNKSNVTILYFILPVYFEMADVCRDVSKKCIYFLFKKCLQIQNLDLGFLVSELFRLSSGSTRDSCGANRLDIKDIVLCSHFS